MNLTAAQLQTLKTWLDANAAGLDDEQAKAALNAPSAPDYYAWLPSVSKQTIDNLIDKAMFTPTDSPPAATGNAQGTNDALLYQNRALVCQLKQANALWLISGSGLLNPSLNSVRKNFQDCLRQIPSGASGANQDGGWGAPATPGAVRLAMMRKVTVGEKLFTVIATGVGNDGGTRGTNTNPDNFGPAEAGLIAVGEITVGNVSQARQPP